MTAATMATTESPATATANIAGSDGDTPNSWGRRRAPPARRRRIPVQADASLPVSLQRDCGTEWSPIATRIPISCVRAATAYPIASLAISMETIAHIPLGEPPFDVRSLLGGGRDKQLPHVRPRRDARIARFVRIVGCGEQDRPPLESGEMARPVVDQVIGLHDALVAAEHEP
jgi:hypothetical protein